jgi:hypothetical protein
MVSGNGLVLTTADAAATLVSDVAKKIDDAHRESKRECW